jgi:hypothetical protein
MKITDQEELSVLIGKKICPKLLCHMDGPEIEPGPY